MSLLWYCGGRALIDSDGSILIGVSRPNCSVHNFMSILRSIVFDDQTKTLAIIRISVLNDRTKNILPLLLRLLLPTRKWVANRRRLKAAGLEQRVPTYSPIADVLAYSRRTRLQPTYSPIADVLVYSRRTHLQPTYSPTADVLTYNVFEVESAPDL